MSARYSTVRLTAAAATRRRRQDGCIAAAAAPAYTLKKEQHLFQLLVNLISRRRSPDGILHRHKRQISGENIGSRSGRNAILVTERHQAQAACASALYVQRASLPENTLANSDESAAASIATKWEADTCSYFVGPVQTFLPSSKKPQLILFTSASINHRRGIFSTSAATATPTTTASTSSPSTFTLQTSATAPAAHILAPEDAGRWRKGQLAHTHLSQHSAAVQKKVYLGKYMLQQRMQERQRRNHLNPRSEKYTAEEEQLQLQLLARTCGSCYDSRYACEQHSVAVSKRLYSSAAAAPPVESFLQPAESSSSAGGLQLRDIVKMPLLRLKSRDEILNIWHTHLEADPTAAAASLTGDQFDSISANAVAAPHFVLPLPRRAGSAKIGGLNTSEETGLTGFEMFYSQFQGPYTCLVTSKVALDRGGLHGPRPQLVVNAYTEFQKDKDLVLLKASVLPQPVHLLQQQEAAHLLACLLRCYSDALRLYASVLLFNQRPREFSFEKFCSMNSPLFHFPLQTPPRVLG